LNKWKFRNQTNFSVLDALTILIVSNMTLRLPQMAVGQKKDALGFQLLAPVLVISW